MCILGEHKEFSRYTDELYGMDNNYTLGCVVLNRQMITQASSCFLSWFL